MLFSEIIILNKVPPLPMVILYHAHGPQQWTAFKTIQSILAQQSHKFQPHYLLLDMDFKLNEGFDELI